MKIILFFCLFFSVISAYANKVMKPMTHIVGNPINRQDDYTINSESPQWINLHCIFTNSGDQPADLQIWIAPNEMKPIKSIHLKPASKATAFQVSEQFQLQLKKHWWCRIYTPKKQQHKWDYCSYFSIADATLVEYKPFGNFDKTIHSKTTSYQCRIKKPNGKTSFFMFR